MATAAWYNMVFNYSYMKDFCYIPNNVEDRHDFIHKIHLTPRQKRQFQQMAETDADVKKLLASSAKGGDNA